MLTWDKDLKPCAPRVGDSGSGAGYGNEQRVREVLSLIDPNCDRERWVNIAMGVKNELGDAGFDAFDAWSSDAKSYKPADTRAVWKSFNAEGGRKFGTVVKYAQDENPGWKSKNTGWKKPTAEELAERAKKDAARNAVHEAEVAAEHAEAQIEAQKAWDAAAGRPATAKHPYFAGKGVEPIGARIGNLPMRNKDGSGFYYINDVVLLRMVDRKGTIHSLQGITAKGDKINMGGGAKKGHFCPIGMPKKNAAGKVVIVLCEGYATGLSIHRATGHAVFACIDDGNIGAVARLIREASKDGVDLIIAADNDTKTPGNPGMTKGTRFAIEVDARLAVPPPGEDFHDWEQREAAASSLERAHALMRRCIEGAKIPTEAFVVSPGPEGASAGPSPCAEQADAAVSRSPALEPEPQQVPGLDEYPCWRVFDHMVFDEEGRTYQEGTYRFDKKKEGKGKDAEPEYYHVRISGPLRVLAQTHDAAGVGSYGRHLEWTTTAGKKRRWAMPASMLAADPKEVRQRLLDLGLYINPIAKQELTRYLSCDPSALKLPSVTCVSKTGWTSADHDAFVLPSVTLGPKSKHAVLQVEMPEEDPYAQRGTLADWRAKVAAPAQRNSAYTLSLSVSFAGPLLSILHAEPGGVHLHGESSKGKSTLLQGSASVWGHHKTFGQSWRTTSNGLEGAAAHRTDTLLVLDEIHQAPASEVGDIVYMLGNGEGKRRANVAGGAREVKKFRVSVLSSGETSVEAVIAQAMGHMRAGQGVRLVDIHVTDRVHGVWDELHQHAGGGELTAAVKTATESNYGHAGPAFVEHVAQADHLALAIRFNELKMRFLARAKGPQEQRVASRMALYALAGEVATEAGLTGWPKGWATEAVVAEYSRWWQGRGVRGHGNREPRQIAQKVVDFVQAYGESRFESASGAGSERVAINRAGWRKQIGGGDSTVEPAAGAARVHYLFTSAALWEATKGFTDKQVLDVLQEAGALITQPSRAKTGKRDCVQRINGENENVYVVDYAALKSMLEAGSD